MDFNKFTLFFRCGREYGRAVTKDLGVNDTEYTICAFLNFYPNAPQELISKSYMLDKTTVAKALQSLEQRGLITREVNPENRRQNLINLTDAGKDLIKDSANVYDDWVEKVSKALSDDEQAAFESMLDKLLQEAMRLKDEAEN
ncbi:MAG: MarR family transcriptional regulator [Oscillospiraceae bacterium]|nr:MarR family transcriptional regulator [Candidatus Limimonas egerieequi]